jgi:hypothetical protein
MAAMIKEMSMESSRETAARSESNENRLPGASVEERARRWDAFDRLLCNSFGRVSPAYLFTWFPGTSSPID